MRTGQGNGLRSVLGMLLAWMAAATAAGVSPGAVYNVTLVTDSSPDLTDIDSYLRSITSQYATPQEQAIAIWRWSQRLRKQTTNPSEDGHAILDPIRLFSSYGYCNCGIISGVNNAFWIKMGWKAHYVQLGDHTVCECSWDDGQTWHMFDASMSFYCFNDRGEVASVREIENNPRFYLENFAPECGTNPLRDIHDHRGWRCASDRPVENQRTLANGFDSFRPPNDITAGNLYAQWGFHYVLNLRPGEHYTRYFQPLEAGGPGTFRPVRGTQDVDSNQVIRANGVWRYHPDLRNPATRDLVYSDSGVTWTKDGVQGPGWIVFKVSAANVVTSAKLSWRGTGGAVSVSRDAGITWTKIDANSGEVDCRGQVAGVSEYLVKVALTGPASRLTSLGIETITQLNRPALPRLTRGTNRVYVRLGQQAETIWFQPSLVAGNHQQSVQAERDIDVERETGYYKPTLRPAAKGTPCFATWKLETPTPITDLVYGGTVCVKSPRDRVTLLHSWDDRTYIRDFQKTDDLPPFDLMVNAAVDAVPAATRTAYLRYEFQTEAYPKSYAGPGIQTAMITVHHRPRITGFSPFEVTYCWTEPREAGEVERQHTELVSSPEHEYTINIGGLRDPKMNWVRMNLQGAGPDGDAVRVGYSDGQDVVPSVKPAWERYRWGRNLALGKKYTLEGPQDQRNPDGGGDLTDGLIAPPDTYVSVKWMPTYVMFAQDASPTVTLDLGASQGVSAVRVHAGQADDFHVSFPDAIRVATSEDGKTFSPAGSATFNQVFAPPADYVPWELDESRLFHSLPAGGRLAYAYRIIFDKPVSVRYVRVGCTGRKGWGLLLSEVQVFDRVTVEKSVPPLVVHQAAAAGKHDVAR